MKFEGTQVNIPIKGIMRAGTDNLCADGAMNEVIGMEYKDGSWLPYKEKEETWSVLKPQLHHGISTWVDLVGITDVYVHKTSDNTSRLLFLVTAQYGNELYYQTEVDQEEHYIKAIRLTTGVRDVSSVGNMLCVAAEAGIEHYLWQSDSNIYLTNRTEYAPLVQLRTTLGIKDDTERTDQIVGLRKTSHIIASNEIEKTKNYKMVAGDATAVIGELRDRGGLVGYVLATYAYRLRNGDIIRASAPVLLGAPEANLVRPYNISKNPDTDLFDGTFKEYNMVDETANVIFQDFLSSELISDYTTESSITPEGFKFIFLKEPAEGVSGYCYTKGGGYFGPSDDVDRKIYLIYQNKKVAGEAYSWPTSRNYEQFQSPLVPPLVCTRNEMIRSSSNHDYCYFAFAASNKIQYKIPAFEAELAKNAEIESICIFMSQEIMPFDIDADGDDELEEIYDKSPNLLMYEKTVDAYSQTYYPRKKTKETLIKEIKDIKSLYLIKEIPVSTITSSDEWIDIDLKGLLGDSLVTLEQFPLTALCGPDTIAKNIDAYNYRAHIFDYTQKQFEGHDISQFGHHGGFFQYAAESLIGSTNKWEIAVYLKDEDGNRKVVNYNKEDVDEIVTSLSPVLSYPSQYAYKMVIKLHNFIPNQGYILHETEYQLTPIKSLEISVYIDQDLKPIDILTDSEASAPPSSIPTESPENIIREYANGLKVSDVAYPYYFPAKFTYRIGNEKIIGLARLTTPVSQDNFGANQLIVFCTDGIYSMTVDTSGNGAYTSIPPLVSPEICVNRNSICEIGGAVFFAGDKGLMMLTGDNQVQLYAPYLNGSPRFLPATTQSKEATGIYKKMVDSTQVLSKTDDTFADSISHEDFVNFIKDEHTHLIYISIKNKLLAYNDGSDTNNNPLYDFSYLIDIPTGNTTKLAMRAECDNGDIVGMTIWEKGKNSNYNVHIFEYTSQNDNEIPCLIQSRPIKIQQDDKCSYRFVITGYFEGLQGNWADLVVLGSLDADNWRVIGVKEKKLEGGFHNLGCITERGSWKYLMFIFGGKLSNNSHIDSVDITVDGRYNNKKR